MILCSGESLIDMVPEGASYRPLPGGAVYNTAIALGRMGADTGYLCLWKHAGCHLLQCAFKWFALNLFDTCQSKCLERLLDAATVYASTCAA